MKQESWLESLLTIGEGELPWGLFLMAGLVFVLILIFRTLTK